MGGGPASPTQHPDTLEDGAKTSDQAGTPDWTFLDRIRAGARGGVESLGRDKQLQIVQNMLRSKEGNSDAGEAQKHAVQAQQRRERADRRKLVREMQSRAQLAPVATPSEQISECLTRSHSTPPVATSHGPSDRITVERERQNAGEVIPKLGTLNRGE